MNINWSKLILCSSLTNIFPGLGLWHEDLLMKVFKHNLCLVFILIWIRKMIQKWWHWCPYDPNYFFVVHGITRYHSTNMRTLAIFFKPHACYNGFVNIKHIVQVRLHFRRVCISCLVCIIRVFIFVCKNSTYIYAFKVTAFLYFNVYNAVETRRLLCISFLSLEFIIFTKWYNIEGKLFIDYIYLSFSP